MINEWKLLPENFCSAWGSKTDFCDHDAEKWGIFGALHKYTMLNDDTVSMCVACGAVTNVTFLQCHYYAVKLPKEHTSIAITTVCLPGWKSAIPTV